ncbi:MAG: transposase [Gluconobacter potus]|uniref:transposase n=1 Tax=Gluconobacter TaxID=441 RepID=UPI001E375429|nr:MULTISPECIES: transposase [Gluconobacter]
MLLAEMPELGRMTATEAAAMTGLAPMSHDSGAMRGKRVISGGRISPPCPVSSRIGSFMS